MKTKFHVNILLENTCIAVQNTFHESAAASAFFYICSYFAINFDVQGHFKEFLYREGMFKRDS